MFGKFSIKGRNSNQRWNSFRPKGCRVNLRPYSSTSIKPKVLILGGPTAVGKSKLAQLLEKGHNGVLVNADATKIYKGLSCGANKTAIGTSKVRLWDLIDATTPNAEFSAGQYHDTAIREVDSIIHDEKKLPIVVGGSGLYLRWFLKGKQAGPARDPVANLRILAQIQDLSWKDTVDRVSQFDPVYAQGLVENDKRRAARALELFERTGLTLEQLRRQRKDSIYDEIGEDDHLKGESASQSDLEANQTQQRKPIWQDGIDFRPFLLSVERKQLYDKICRRCEMMLIDGLFQEVWGLMKMGLTVDSTPGKAIGYRQTIDYLNRRHFNEESFMAYLLDFQSKTRQLAHRQISWFRKEIDFYPLDISNAQESYRMIDSLLALPKEDWKEQVRKARESVIDQDESIQLALRTYQAPAGLFFLPHLTKKQRNEQYYDWKAKRTRLIEDQLAILHQIHREMIETNFR